MPCPGGHPAHQHTEKNIAEHGFTTVLPARMENNRMRYDDLAVTYTIIFALLSAETLHRGNSFADMCAFRVSETGYRRANM